MIDSVKRIALAGTLAIAEWAIAIAVMFVVPGPVCPVFALGGLAASIAGADFAIRSKPLAFFRGVTIFAAVVSAAVRGLLG